MTTYNPHVGSSFISYMMTGKSTLNRGYGRSISPCQITKTAAD